MYTPPIALIATASLCLVANAWAGRPLGNDDASTTTTGTCQVESWVEREARQHAVIVAPACGVAKDMELDLDYTLPEQRDVQLAASGVAFKWVPQSWRADTSIGELNFGLKLSAIFEHPAGANWRGTQTSLLGLATLKLSDAWAAHANLGAAREHASGTAVTLLNLSLVWTPSAPGLLFAETRTNNRHAVFGGTVNSVGGRWWLISDRFGLDLSASREAGSARPTLWSVGFGWYELSF